MRRITIWITATLAIVALVIAYQLNLSGGGKNVDEGEARDAPAAGASSPGPVDGGADADHTAKPGENK